jgi:FkbM family methyltransferase
METTKLGKFIITYTNSIEYHSLKREIWGQNIYHFVTNNPQPLIVDIGAHIGVSILYFKSIYPDSRILAFEPNPISVDILKENILINGLEDITLIEKAVWKEKALKSFYIDSTGSEWYSNSSLLENSWNGKEKTEKINVETVRLEEYIDEKIDLLKVDTEGTELTIIKSIKRILPTIENIVVEYHPSRDNNLSELLGLLKINFEIEVLHQGKQISKLLEGKLLTIKGKKRI